MSAPRDPNEPARARPSPAEARKARLAAELRANLKRRKALARSRDADESTAEAGGPDQGGDHGHPAEPPGSGT